MGANIRASTTQPAPLGKGRKDSRPAIRVPFSTTMAKIHWRPSPQAMVRQWMALRLCDSRYASAMKARMPARPVNRPIKCSLQFVIQGLDGLIHVEAGAAEQPLPLHHHHQGALFLGTHHDDPVLVCEIGR